MTSTAISLRRPHSAFTNPTAALKLVWYLLLASLSACSAAEPLTRPYTPEAEWEKKLFTQARRDILPNDVKQNLEAFRTTVMVWTGISREIEVVDEDISTTFEHHYWDWIEDYRGQQEVAFVSPRGEGTFVCKRSLFPTETPDQAQQSVPQVGEMAIIYARPLATRTDGSLLMDCNPSFRILPPGSFSTTTWDYGRRFVLNGDKSDMRELRLSLGTLE